MRVALVNPPVNSKTQVWDKPPYPSLALGYLAGYLKANSIEVLAIDAPFEGYGLEEVKEHLIKFQPQALGLTAMTPRIIQAAKVGDEIKKLFPKLTIIIGGPHATVDPVGVLSQFPSFDIAVMGEGERTLLEIVKLAFLKKNGFDFEQLASIKGIARHTEDNMIRINGQREFINELDSIPFPNYDHIKRKIEIYPIFSSRGCPFRCIFCCRIHGNRLKVRSPENVVNEIEYAIQKFHPKLIDFADDQFTHPKSRIIEICDLMIDKGLNKRIKWTCLSRVAGVDQELFDKMKRAGCIKVDFGVESGNANILKIIKKGITIADAENAITMAKKAGLKTASYFIIGHPYETLQTIRDTVKLAKKLNTTTVSFGIMVPYPGTEVYEMAIKGEGSYKLISQRWEDFDKQIGNALELKNLSRRQLERLQIKAYIAFYFYNWRFLELMQMVLSQRKLLWRIMTKIGCSR